MRRYLPIVVLALLASYSARAESVTLEPLADATLIEHPTGALANGSGPFFFVGRTAQLDRSVRRAVVRFDVASALPARAIVEGASLSLTVAPSNAGPLGIRLHRVLAAWGEGPATSSSGSGAPAGAGDVTWRHRFWDTSPWVRPGGQFVARTSAELEVGSPGSYTWSGAALVQDVLLWRSAPSRNFGWMLVSDEVLPQTVKSFASREHDDPELRPRLTIRFRVPGRGLSVPPEPSR